MINLKAVIQYDGTNYKGWQVQNSTGDTIQGRITEVLKELTGENVEVIGSGRTDAGVHALGQVANFHMNMPEGMKISDLLFYINRKLPMDIAVISLEEVDERFHARYSAKTKTYRYRIHVSQVANVFEKRFVYTYLDQVVDVEKIKTAAEALVGTHDFKAFCGNKHMKKTTVRTIYSIEVKDIYDENGLKEICLEYTGDGFLQNMIRIITGTLIEIGNGRKAVSDIQSILEAKDRGNAGFTAPPQGLSLLKVEYS